MVSNKEPGEGVQGWRLPGTWLVAQGALGPPPSLPPGEGTGPAVMPFVLALGLGAAVLSEECGTIERTQRREAELSSRRLELRLGPGGPTKQEACGTPGPTQCPPACCPDPPGGPDALGHFCCTQDHVGVCHGDIKGRRGRKERNQPADCAPAGRKGRQPGSSSPAAH